MSSIAIDQQQRDRRTGAIGTVVVHVLLLLLFLLIGLDQPHPLPEEYHIELVMEDAGGGGAILPAAPDPQPASAAAPVPVEETPEPVATQAESPVAVPKPEKPEPDPKPAEPAPRTPNRDALFAPSNTPSAPSSGTTGPGSTSSTSGGGGGGIGSFHGQGFEGRLDGRGLARTPSFRNDNTEAGKVAVDIRVDPTGTVVYAKGRLDRPTTTTSSQLHRLAEGYAREFRFSANPGATTDQAGFIVFEFILQ